MSKAVKVRTEQGLGAFLSLLAEESVIKAREDLRNGTYASEEEILRRAAGDEKKSQSSLSKDLDTLGSSWGSEFKPMQPAAEADDDIFKTIAKSGKKGSDEEGEKKPSKKTSKEPEEPEEDNSEDDEADKSSGRVGGEERISFTMIRDELNTIRSGRSLRDTEIRTELKDYVTGLDADERIALHAFLRGIGQILTAGIESEKADDPSEDPHDIEMSRSDDQSQGQKPKAKKKGVVKKPVNRAKQRGLEDTSAPIQVGSKQKTESIRRRLRDLMG